MAAPPERVPAVLRVEVGLVQNVCSLICDPATSTCALVDPAFEVDRLLRTAGEHGYRVGAVLLSHSHLDHIEGVPALRRRLGPLPVYIGAAELDAVAAHCAREGTKVDLLPLPGDGELHVGELLVQVLATPGHTPAGRSFYLPALGALLPGDTLFVGSVGRPRTLADAPQLWASLMRLCDELPEETRVFPGHDYGPTPTTTLGRERDENPYLRCADAAAFTALCRRRL
jgi:hydroxyacylglutathione hydrolase